jgi:hypothetical protein
MPFSTFAFVVTLGRRPTILPICLRLMSTSRAGVSTQQIARSSRKIGQVVNLELVVQHDITNI